MDRVKLKDLIDYEQPSKYIVKTDEYDDTYLTPVLTAGQSFILGYTNEKDNIFDASNKPVILFDDFTTSTKYVDFPFKVKSSALKILSNKPNNDILFLYYAINSIRINTSVHKRYWISDFSERSINKYSFEEQKAISNELKAISDAIENRKKTIELLEEYSTTLFMKSFDNNTEYIKIGDKLKTMSGGTPLKSHKEYYNGNIPWLTSGEVNQGFIYETKNFITKKGLTNSSAKIFPVDTVLVAMYGATAGQVGLLKIESSTNQAICGIMPDSKLFDPIFLYYALKNMKKIMVSKCVGGAQPNISQDIIRNLEIPKPSLSMQKEFSMTIKKIDEEINNKLCEIQLLNEALNNKMNKYFN